jgi:tetratricopeptide (TPR) repeat protein
MLRADYSSEVDDNKSAAADYQHVISLDDKSIAAYEGLAEAKLGLRDYQGAIATTTTALAIKSDSMGALASRAIAETQLGDLVSAKRDLNKYCAAEPGNYIMRFNLATVDYELDDMQGAASQYEAVLAAAKPDFKNGAYAGILCSFAYRHLGNADSADKALRTSSKFSASPWAQKCAEYLLGKVSAEALETAASDNGQRTEAKTYIGINSLLNGDAKTATACFDWVKDHGERDFYEYRLAQIEANHFGKASPGATSRSPAADGTK